MNAPDPTSAPTLLAELRRHTGKLHSRLDSSPILARLGDPAVTALDVLAAMKVLYRGFSAAEPVLRGESWYRPQLPAIVADLETAGHLPLSAPELSAESPAARLGVAYVLVGSRLGARHTARQLAERFGEEFLRNSRFYGGEREHTPQQWAELIARLKAVDDAEAQVVCDAAVATFEIFLEAAGAENGPGTAA